MTDSIFQDHKDKELAQVRAAIRRHVGKISDALKDLPTLENEELVQIKAQRIEKQAEADARAAYAAAAARGVNKAPAPSVSAPLTTPAAEPAAVAVLDAAAAGPETVTTHITSHKNTLTNLVVKAQNTCDDRYDTTAVFIVLRSWAEQEKPPLPLWGLTKDGKIQWRDINDKFRELKRSDLAKRLKRQQKSTKPPPVGEQLHRIK